MLLDPTIAMIQCAIVDSVVDIIASPTAHIPIDITLMSRIYPMIRQAFDIVSSIIFPLS